MALSEGNINTLGFVMGGPMTAFALDQFQDMNQYEQSGVVTGALTGAATGAMVGGPIGAVVGAGVGAIGGYLMGKSQGDSAQRAQDARDEARREAMVREFGIMQQRSNSTANQAKRAMNTSNRNASEALSQAGFMGQNMINSGGVVPSSAGTF